MWYSLKNHHISRDVGHFLVPQGAIHFSLETTSKTSIFIGGISTPVMRTVFGIGQIHNKHYIIPIDIKYIYIYTYIYMYKYIYI